MVPSVRILTINLGAISAQNRQKSLPSRRGHNMRKWVSKLEGDSVEKINSIGVQVGVSFFLKGGGEPGRRWGSERCGHLGSSALGRVLPVGLWPWLWMRWGQWRVWAGQWPGSTHIFVGWLWLLCWIRLGAEVRAEARDKQCTLSHTPYV